MQRLCGIWAGCGKMTQLYWQVYLDLERELFGLAETIYINDEQQDVYSLRIADLLIRTVLR